MLPADHYLVRRKSNPKETYTRIGHGQCDQCSLCTELCPRYILGYPIEPHRVMRTLLMSGAAKQQGSLWAQYCCECNICSLVACPESLDPMNICVDAKAILRENQGLARTESELEQLFRRTHPAREGREVPISRALSATGSDGLRPQGPLRGRTACIPKQVTIPLGSHIGKPASPQVALATRSAAAT